MSLEHFHPNYKPAYISGTAEPLDVKGICKERNKNILKSDFAFVSRRMKNPMLHAAIMRMRLKATDKSRDLSSHHCFKIEPAKTIMKHRGCGASHCAIGNTGLK